MRIGAPRDQQSDVLQPVRCWRPPLITLGSSRRRGRNSPKPRNPPRDETGGWAPAEVTTAVLEQHDAVLGRQVRSIAGEDMGRVVNVVVDQSGQVRALTVRTYQILQQ